MIVIGLMSGTSADGIDAVVVRLAGAPPALTWQVLAHVHRPYLPALRDEIFACFRPETGHVERLCRLNFALGRAFGEAVLDVIAAAGLTPAQADLVGSHGQTLWHIPAGPDASTLQLGEPAVIAEMTGLPVVSNFRPRDMAAGGQGAPLVAYVDALLHTHPDQVRAAQNIGGIANVTYLPPANAADQQPFAFDTGPGNVLIDYAANRASGGALTCDHDGALAAQGRVDEALLAELMAEPYLLQPPPKTTGRERFGAPLGDRIWEGAVVRGLAPQDMVATLTVFTAQSIARAYSDFLPQFPVEVIVSGGGARNPTLMAQLRERLAPARVILSDKVGLSAEAKEAVAFALLAYETWHRRPGNLSLATGARCPVVLGNITPASRPIGPPVHQQPLVATESRNPATEDIDVVPTLEMVQLMNAEDAKVAPAIAIELRQIAAAVDAIAERMRAGGRLIYIGAGTSGRIGVLDASECPPTFGTAPEQVVGLIAGGTEAITTAIEGAEDDHKAGAHAIIKLNVTAQDSVVGIASSGRTPYVLGGLQQARACGALTVSLASNRPAPIQSLADINITPIVGPEALTGSTRLKAGTAQKMVLNLISTGVMIRLGKTFSNLMVDVQPTNAKLRARARRIVAQAGASAQRQFDEGESGILLQECDGEVKTAIVSLLADVTPQEARERLKAASGVVRQALESDA
jgi:N-acetylmuramic acid 6-phosphate etherase